MDFQAEFRKLNSFVTLTLQGEILKARASRTPHDKSLDPYHVVSELAAGTPPASREALMTPFLRRFTESEIKQFIAEYDEESYEFIKSEEESGFAYLWATAIIRLWSLVEEFVRATAVEKLRDFEKLPSHPLLDDLAAKAVKLGKLNVVNRTEFLYNRLADLIPRSDRRGIARYEKILEAVGLRGDVPATLREVLNELCEIRNAVVHRHGICDFRVEQRCPELSLKLGAPIRIRHLDFEIYVLAADTYHVEILRRQMANEEAWESRALVQFNKRFDELCKWKEERRVLKRAQAG